MAQEQRVPMIPLTLEQLDRIARLVRAIGTGDDEVPATANVRTSTELECRAAEQPYRRTAQFADGAARMATVLISPTSDPRRFWVMPDGRLSSPYNGAEVPE